MTNHFDIQDYIRPLLRWWWLLAVATVLALLSSFIYTQLQPPIYMSRATMVVGMDLRNPNPEGGRLYLAQQLAETYADIANREPLREATKKALGLTWLPYYVVTQITGKPMIEVQVYAEDSNVAFAVAQELVNQIFLQGPKEEQARSDFMNQQLAKLQVSITQTEEDIVTSENALLSINSARELANAQAEISALQEKLATLRENYANLLATTQEGAVNALRLLEPPTPPETPVDSGLLLNMLVAAAVGLMLASAGAYLLDYLDDSLKSGDELKRMSSATLLGAVPQIDEAEVGSQRKLIATQNIQSAALEAYRAIRTNLQFASIDTPLRAILVSSPQPEDGKSLTAANLGIVLARAGKQVILVDADLHRPTQHRLFSVYNNIGVTTALLVENADLAQLVQSTSVPGLSLLTSGPLPPNPAELLGSRRMQDLIVQLKKLADVVILDSPPLTAVVDSLILSGQTDGVVLVVRANKTSRDATRRSLASLQQVHARLFGTVLNGVKATGQDYYYKKYGYYNKAHESSSTGEVKAIVPVSKPSHPPVATPMPSSAKPPTANPAPGAPPQTSESSNALQTILATAPATDIAASATPASEQKSIVTSNGALPGVGYNGSRSNGVLRNSLLSRRRPTPPQS